MFIGRHTNKIDKKGRISVPKPFRDALGDRRPVGHVEDRGGCAPTLLLRLLDARSHAVRYRLGEGIVGKVVESSRPIVVPRVSEEPTFLNRAAKRTASRI